MAAARDAVTLWPAEAVSKPGAGAVSGAFLVASSTRISFRCPGGSPGGGCLEFAMAVEVPVLEETVDAEVIIERVAALDIGKAALMCCARVPGKGSRRRLQEVRSCATMTGSLLRLADRLAGLAVSRVVMEASSR